MSSGERDEREREGYVEYGFLCGSWEEREREEPVIKKVRNEDRESFVC